MGRNRPFAQAIDPDTQIKKPHKEAFLFDKSLAVTYFGYGRREAA